MKIQKITNNQSYGQNNSKKSPSFGMYFGIKSDVISKLKGRVSDYKATDWHPNKLITKNLEDSCENFITKFLRDMVEHNETSANHRIYNQIYDIDSITLYNHDHPVNQGYKVLVKNVGEFSILNRDVALMAEKGENIITKFQNSLIKEKTSTKMKRQADQDYLLSKLSYVQKKNN